MADDEFIELNSTEYGKVLINKNDLAEALNPLQDDVEPPEENIDGWALVWIRVSEKEKYRQIPILMRNMTNSEAIIVRPPADEVARHASQVKEDDEEIQNIVLREVYKLTPFRIRLLKIGRWFKSFFKKRK